MSCLYRHFDAQKNLLYVGVSLSAVARLSQHMNDSGWADQIASIKVERFPSRAEALAAETKAIQTENPKFNVQKVLRKEPERSEAHAREGVRLIRQVALKPVYNLTEAGQALGMSSSAVSILIFEGKLQHFMVGNRRKVSGWHLIDFLESQGAL